jgi:hypothetical protein
MATCKCMLHDQHTMAPANKTCIGCLAKWLRSLVDACRRHGSQSMDVQADEQITQKLGLTFQLWVSVSSVSVCGLKPWRVCQPN